jgi:hypothetical protein
VHGAFAGYTGFTVGLVNTHYVYLPIPTIIQAPRKVNPKGRRWNRCARACGSVSELVRVPAHVSPAAALPPMASTMHDRLPLQPASPCHTDAG